MAVAPERIRASERSLPAAVATAIFSLLVLAAVELLPARPVVAEPAPERLRARERFVPAAAVRAIVAVLVLAGAELLVVERHVVGALVVDAALALCLANLAAAAGLAGAGRLFGALTLVPLARLLGLTMPLGGVPPLYWNALVGAPLLPALALAARAYGFPFESLRLRRRALLRQLLVAGTGVPLGIAGYALLRPAAPPPRLDWSHLLFGSLTLLVFAALVEELLFRGLLQQAACRAFGAIAGGVFVNIVFAVTAIGSLSPGYALFAGLMGGWFSLAAGRSRCLWGVVGAHALAAIGLVLVWPVILG